MPGALTQVLHQATDSGQLWAAGNSWKASFGPEGCTYFPLFGAGMARHYPIRFVIRRVTVGSRQLEVLPAARPERSGDLLWFDRGAVRERYQLTPDRIEQSFVIEAEGPGDLVLELAVATELREDTERPGLQFGNAFGHVAYGDAFVLREDQRAPIRTEWLGDALRFVVPAALRGAGPVVIDPIIGTYSPTGGNPQRPVHRPAAAYAAGSQTWLLAWESIPASPDRDIYCQAFARNGLPIAGSAAAIDITTDDYSDPAIGTLYGEDRFLIAFTATKPTVFQGRAQVHGRVRAAAASAALSPEFLISDPTVPGSAYGPEIGGDRGMAPTPSGWLVAWSNNQGYPQQAIRWRLCGPAGNLLGQERVAPTIHGTQVRPSLSPCNGRDRVAQPGWMLCYEEHDPAVNNQDVFGVWLDLQGAVRHHFAIAATPQRDVVPSVSSPAPTIDGAATRVVVAHKHGVQLDARANVITFGATATVLPTADLTAAFGFTSRHLEVETDGIRFAVLAGVPGTPQTGFATLAFDAAGAAVMHDPLFPVPGAATWPRVASEYGGGGGGTSCAAVYGDSNGSFSSWILFSLYRAHAPGPQLMFHPRACDGLQTQWSGEPVLGQSMQFVLSGHGQGLPGFAIGEPDLFGPELCPGCFVGLRLDQPIGLALGSATFDLAIPAVTSLVGQTYGVQGLRLGGGLCFGALSVGDLLTLTIR